MPNDELSDFVISLGDNCEVAYHISRAGLPTLSCPFDNAATSHESLLDCIGSDFENVFSGKTLRIGCYETKFIWGHQPKEELGKEIKQRWQTQIRNFLSLKSQNVLFIRRTEDATDLESQYEDIVSCLKKSGFCSFHLVFAVKGECESTERWFPLKRTPDYEGKARWKGSQADWDEFFEGIMPRVRSVEDEASEEKVADIADTSRLPQLNESVFFGWVAANPPILYYACGMNTDIGPCLPDMPIYRLRKYSWCVSVEEITDYHQRALSTRPQDKLIHMVNVEAHANQLMCRGIPAYFVSHNCFLDEALFTIDATAEKEFDAVYNARMAPFKRHALAKSIPTPLFIGGIASVRDELEHFAKVRSEVLQGAFTHAKQPDKYITPSEIVGWLNRSKVGLCLSAKEGAMYSAVEYMLCGLPVVSTVSEGGRDEWFDTRYVRVVSDDAPAVAKAVNELIHANISPDLIRQNTLSRIREQRLRFVSILQMIFQAEHCSVDASRHFYRNFRHKLGRWHGRPTSTTFLEELQKQRVKEQGGKSSTKV